MNKLLRIVGIVTLLAASLTANASAGERGPKAKAGKPMGPMAALNLTPEQKQKLDQIHEDAAKQAEPLHKELAGKMKEMQALWAVDKPDKAAIERKHAEMNAIHGKLWGIHIDSKLQVHALLTPEQRAKWASGPGPGMHGPGKPGMHGSGMPGMYGPGCPMHGGDCPCMHGGDCPCMKGAGCPCMHGAGPGKGPGGPAAPPTPPKPDKK
jgi:Spy/CpxP family protein refolding chaperone